MNLIKTYNVSGLINAIKLTKKTLIASSGGKYPLSMGNCFSLLSEDGNEYRVVNFILENLNYLIEHNKVNFPILILPLSKNIAVVCDKRIPDKFYLSKFCEVCTPEELLPLSQRLKQLLDIQKGVRNEIKTELGKIVSRKVEPKIRRVNTGWTYKINL